MILNRRLPAEERQLDTAHNPLCEVFPKGDHLHTNSYLQITWLYPLFSGSVPLPQVRQGRRPGDQSRHLYSLPKHDQRQGDNTGSLEIA